MNKEITPILELLKDTKISFAKKILTCRGDVLDSNSKRRFNYMCARYTPVNGQPVYNMMSDCQKEIVDLTERMIGGEDVAGDIASMNEKTEHELSLLTKRDKYWLTLEYNLFVLAYKCIKLDFRDNHPFWTVICNMSNEPNLSLIWKVGDAHVRFLIDALEN